MRGVSGKESPWQYQHQEKGKHRRKGKEHMYGLVQSIYIFTQLKVEGRKVAEILFMIYERKTLLLSRGFRVIQKLSH